MERNIVKMLRLLPLLLLALAPDAYAGSLDSSVMGMFPKDVGEFGCADLSQARQLSWYPQFEAQLVPVSLYAFEQFLEAAQMGQTSPIEEVAWARMTASDADSDRSAAGTGQLVGVAVGEFDADAIQSFLNSRKIPSVQMGNYTLYDAGTGSGASDVFFTVIDWKTIAFGPLQQLKRILNVRRGEEENLLENQTMMTLIDEANGDAMLWGVLDSAHTGGAIGQLVPGVASFPQSQGLIRNMKDLLIVVRVSSDIELELQAASGSKEEAILLSQLLQAAVLLQSYQTSTVNPSLAQMLNNVSIAANGNSLDVSFILTNAQLINLIEHNTFTGNM